MRFIDRPAVGYFKTRLVKGGPWCAARIVSRASQPDRSPVLVCFVAGEEVDDIHRVWPSLHPVSEAEYHRLLNHMPAQPREPVALAERDPMF